MSRRLLNLKTRSNFHRVGLYSVVYTGKISAFAVVLLFVSFMVQPFHEAFAAEDIILEPEPETITAEPVKEQVEEVEAPAEIELPDVAEEILPPVEEPEPSNDEEVESNVEASTDPLNNPEISSTPATETEVSTEEIDEPLESENVTASTSQAEPVTTSATTTESLASTTDLVSSTSTAPVNQNSGSGGSSSSNDASATSTDVDLDNPADSNQEDIVEESTEQNTATTTEDAIATTTLITDPVQAEIIVTEENFYQFSRQSCVAVGDGTYHCTSSEEVDYDTQSVAYAELGESGNMEIYLQTSEGEVKQVTDNEYEDTAPYYDAETLQVVWQRLIDDRFQIILYDIAEDKESQLTFSRTNNMEPKVSEDGVVWQAWDNNDWEIMYFDGVFTDQITDNQLQDVTPVIQDSYVLWTVIGRSDQEAKVYSLQSGEILTIDNHEGGSIANPRFVLVYDTKFENGDIITKGFDPATGISEQISAKAAPEPVEIPLTDTTGEIRALIQNKSNFEDEIEKQIISGNNGSSTDNVSDDTLNLKGQDTSTSTVAITATSTDEILELTEFDLILTESNINFDELDEIEDLLNEVSAASELDSTQE